jgi:VanZ family protein
MKRLRYLPLLLATLLVAVAALLPNFTMADLRVAMPWFSHLINLVEAIHPGVDSTHVLMFLMVGVALVMALHHRDWPRRIGLALCGVLLAALASEFVQFWVPGRTPLWSDVRDDLLGGAVGVLLAWVLLAALAWVKRSKGAG